MLMYTPCSRGFFCQKAGDGRQQTTCLHVEQEQAAGLSRPSQTLHSQLDLRGNALGNDGAILIGRGLRSHENKALAELDLGYNEIKDDGACALAQVGFTS